MEFTGERVVPGQVDADLWQEHLSRYVYARNWIKPGADVRDVGCGTGYGSAILAASAARRVLALDIDAESIAWARDRYRAPNLEFKQADCREMLDFDASFDLIVAFEVIEHLEHAETFLKEARRVLRKAGVFLVSTPNRRYYTEERGVANPFHVREYDAAEFQALLETHFGHVQLLAQNHVPAIAFTAPGAAMSVAFPDRTARDRTPESQAHFFLAVCSQEPQDVNGIVYLPETGNVLREREQHIHKLEANLAALQAATNRELEERREWAARLNAELREKGEFIAGLERELEERRQWVQDLERRIAERDAQIIERQQTVEKVESELRERAEWAAALESRIAERDQQIIERQSAVEQLEAGLRERSAWAQSLDADLARARARVQELGAEVEERNAWAAGLNAEVASLGARLAATHRQLEAASSSLSAVLGSNWYRAGKLLRLAPDTGGRTQP